MLHAANRDPRQFPGPDRLDLTRAANRHLVFGYGIHFCLGAPLARMEGQIGFPALLRRLPGIELTEPAPAWTDSLVLRGVKSLRVRASAPHNGRAIPRTPPAPPFRSRDATGGTRRRQPPRRTDRGAPRVGP